MALALSTTILAVINVIFLSMWINIPAVSTAVSTDASTVSYFRLVTTSSTIRTFLRLLDIAYE